MNPDLPDAQQSRAGLYLKNMEPNIVSNTAANLRYMIGPMSIARENGMYILPQWRMECDVSGADWYQTTLEMARSRPERPVSPGCIAGTAASSYPAAASPSCSARSR